MCKRLKNILCDRNTKCNKLKRALFRCYWAFFRRSDQKVNSIASHNTILDEGIWFNSTKFFTTEIARNA